MVLGRIEWIPVAAACPTACKTARLAAVTHHGFGNNDGERAHHIAISAPIKPAPIFAGRIRLRFGDIRIPGTSSAMTCAPREARWVAGFSAGLSVARRVVSRDASLGSETILSHLGRACTILQGIGWFCSIYNVIFSTKITRGLTTFSDIIGHN